MREAVCCRAGRHPGSIADADTNIDPPHGVNLAAFRFIMDIEPFDLDHGALYRCGMS